MWETKNAHLKHTNARKLVVKNLPGSRDMDAIYGYYNPYHVEWKNIKLLVKVANSSKKSNKSRAKWYYTLREKDHQATDYFILFAIIKNRVGAVYVLPKPLAPLTTITISKLNGNVRYDYFKTDLEHLASKILKVQKDLPRLVQIYREAKFLKES